MDFLTNLDFLCLDSIGGGATRVQRENCHAVCFSQLEICFSLCFSTFFSLHHTFFSLHHINPVEKCDQNYHLENLNHQISISDPL